MKAMIGKFGPLGPGLTEIAMDQRVEIQHVHEQRGAIYIWGVIIPASKTIIRKFWLFGTGEAFDLRADMKYIGTCHVIHEEHGPDGACRIPLVFHVYEQIDWGPFPMPELR